MSGRKILFVSGFSRDARAKDLAYEFERYGRLVRCDIPSTRGGGGARTIKSLRLPLLDADVDSPIGPVARFERCHSIRKYFDFDSFCCELPCTIVDSIHLTPGELVTYAFIEFRSDRDAEDAYHSMHGQMIDRHRISVQWARRPPSALWRHDSPRPRGGRDRRDDRDRDRRERDRSRSRSPRRDDKDKERDRRRSRTRSRSRDRRDRDRDEERDEPRTREDRDDVDEREDRRRRSLSREPNGVPPVEKEEEPIKKEEEPVAEEAK
ncbi:unnamed protein product [Rhizoctonia solani]|uniref:RRM domain-containing protein n=1 Tax=Rhizoctonia solani TaxID=456999 RepID=A0A8H2WPG1_9AGAM|nr:unnamed protein product [Rhizoctonia solani]CAE6465725.1 unnamed protein product [Rhizoctonia solani]